MLENCKHVFKLDPNKTISDEDLERICESNTDLIIIGGTDGVTQSNVLDLMARSRRYFTPIALELSNLEAVVPGFDHYFVPAVFNTTDMKFQHGLLLEALKRYAHLLDFDTVSLMPYLIFNESCKAYQYAKCKPIPDEDIEHYVNLIDKMYRQKYMYIEYSGSLADVETLKQIHQAKSNIHMIYGGGIQSKEDFKRRMPHADTIVVGNLIYEDIEAALNTVI